MAAISRRHFLTAAATCGAVFPLRAATNLLPASRRRRVVIVGGSWGGLSAAMHLRRQAPELDVVLLERHAGFQSLPLSNRWLGGFLPGGLPSLDLATAARAHGYLLIQDEVRAIDREHRRVHAGKGILDYDWLVIAAGIRHDYAAWFGNDARAIDHARTAFGCAYVDGREVPHLRQRLEAFGGGDLLMTLPPPPYRCPPAPYERALMIGWLLKSRRVAGRLIVIDPNHAPAGFVRLFADEYRDQITYVPDTRIRSVDPFARRVDTDFDEYRFDDAILMPPQQAADLVWQADLIGTTADGRKSGWASQHPLELAARGDDRCFVIGDAAGPVSELFGSYPKTAQMAQRMGSIVAAVISEQATGRSVPRQLPESNCHVVTRVEPMELMRIDTRYRIRGDGEIVQSVTQTLDRQPRDEDVAWAAGLLAETFGIAAAAAVPGMRPERERR
jgi:NADPH-dependent 2,4-dienoyl-CoA reductase/sulfur reductase-like enzyme